MVFYCSLLWQWFAQQLSSSLIEIPESHLSPFPSASLFLGLLNSCWLIAFRACMAVSNCINLKSHIRQRLFKRHSYSANCIVGNALGRCNQSHWSREEELIIYWSHTLFSIAPLPISNTASSVPIPLFSNFLISAFSSHPSHFLHFKNCSLPNLIFSSVTHGKRNLFFRSLVWWQWITGRNKSTSVWKFTKAFIFQLCYYITTALRMGDYCQMRRLDSVHLPAWWLLCAF